MKLTMQLTLDGLVRALRLKAHGLAEDIEGGYRRERRRAKENAPLPTPTARRERTREEDDDRAGR